MRRKLKLRSKAMRACIRKPYCSSLTICYIKLAKLSNYRQSNEIRIFHFKNVMEQWHWGNRWTSADPDSADLEGGGRKRGALGWVRMGKGAFATSTNKREDSKRRGVSSAIWRQLDARNVEREREGQGIQQRA